MSQISLLSSANSLSRVVLVDKSSYWVGLDVGGTKLSISLVFENDEPLNLGYMNLSSLSDIRDAASQLLGDFTLKDANGIGVGVAGWISSISKSVVFSPHRPELVGVQIPALLNDSSLSRVVLENDANCAALAERDNSWGPLSVIVNFGTGIGMSALYQGQLFKGANGFFGELGHCYVGGSLLCECGATGCLEAELRSCFVSDQDKAEIAAEKKRRYVMLGAHGVSWIIRIMNPSEVIVGGGVPLGWDSFVEEISAEVSRYFPSSHSFVLPKFKAATYKEFSGSVGAAILARSIFN